MMAGNPNWWSMQHPPSLIPLGVVGSSSSSSSIIPPLNFLPEPQESPHSWSQMLFAGLPGEEERMMGAMSHFETKKLENWEDHHHHHHHQNHQIIVDDNINININNNSNNPSSSSTSSSSNSRANTCVNVDVVKPEVSQSGNISLYGHHHHHEQQFLGSASHHHHHASSYNWTNNNIMMPLITNSNNINSAPNNPHRLITSLINSNNVLDFTYNNKPDYRKNQLSHHPSHQCNNNTTASVGVCNKKPRVQPSPTQTPLKVRKEKLGDRITALHQLVSPFGKTDTASVLLEAIGYIRFLQGQIEALSSPYLAKASKNTRNQHCIHGERNAVFPEDPGQLLNDTHGLKRKGASISNQDGEEKRKDLKSRGLCLVPVSCTQHVGSENGADYWAPPYGSGF